MFMNRLNDTDSGVGYEYVDPPATPGGRLSKVDGSLLLRHITLNDLQLFPKSGFTFSELGGNVRSSKHGDHTFRSSLKKPTGYTQSYSRGCTGNDCNFPRKRDFHDAHLAICRVCERIGEGEKKGAV